MTRTSAIIRLHEAWWDTDGRADLESSPGHEADFVTAMRALGVSDSELVDIGCHVPPLTELLHIETGRGSEGTLLYRAEVRRKS